MKEGKLRRKGEGERGESESVCMSECKLECCVQPQLACDVVVRGVTHPWVGRWSSGPPHNLTVLSKERKEKDRKDGGKEEREGGKIEEGRKRNSESVYMSMSECKLKCC